MRRVAAINDCAYYIQLCIDVCVCVCMYESVCVID